LKTEILSTFKSPISGLISCGRSELAKYLQFMEKLSKRQNQWPARIAIRS